MRMHLVHVGLAFEKLVKYVFFLLFKKKPSPRQKEKKPRGVVLSFRN